MNITQSQIAKSRFTSILTFWCIFTRTHDRFGVFRAQYLGDCLVSSRPPRPYRLYVGGSFAMSFSANTSHQLCGGQASLEFAICQFARGVDIIAVLPCRMEGGASVQARPAQPATAQSGQAHPTELRVAGSFGDCTELKTGTVAAVATEPLLRAVMRLHSFRSTPLPTPAGPLPRMVCPNGCG